MSMGEIKFELGDRVYDVAPWRLWSTKVMGTIVRISKGMHYDIRWDNGEQATRGAGSLYLDEEYAFYKDILKLKYIIIPSIFKI